MGDRKRFFVLFSFYDKTRIEKYLEAKAQEGWLLEKMSSFGWRFKRIEPKKLKYFVSYFPKASAFDPEMSDEQLSFNEFCEHTGWKLASSNAQIQVFYNEKENPVPIETEAIVEVQTIHKAVKKSFLPVYFMDLFLGIMMSVMFISRYKNDPISLLASNASLFSVICWINIIVMCSAELGRYYSWRKKALKQAENGGEFLETKGTTGFQMISLIFIIAALLFMLISYGSSKMTAVYILSLLSICAITAFIVFLSALMKKLKVKSGINRIVTIIVTVVLSFGLTGFVIIKIFSTVNTVFPDNEAVGTYEYKGNTFKVYKDNIPLKIEDITETDYEGYSYRLWNENESVFLKTYSAVQSPRMDALDKPDLSYTVTEVKMSVLYDLCKRAALENFAKNYSHYQSDYEFRKESVETDASKWGAESAYQLYMGGEKTDEFLVCFKDKIIAFDFDWEINEEQMKLCGEIFK